MRPGCVLTAGMLAAASFACGGGDRHPNAPTPVASPPPRGVVAGSVVTTVRGDTGAPIEGAVVTVAGRSYVTDAAGTARIEDAAAPGSFVDVTAPSILDRQTTVGTGPLGTLAGWPRTTASGVDEAFTSTLVYTKALLLSNGPPGQEPLRRIASGRTPVIVLHADILADEFAHAAHIAAVATINAAARGIITYTMAAEAPAAEPVFTARIDTGDPSCLDRVLALTRYTLRAGEIVGGEIVYCSRQAPHRLALVVHEIGHTFGLQHSLDPRDMMFSTINAAHAVDFRPREADVMSLMMQRRAGNRFPDSDRDVAGASALEAETSIVCR